MYSTVWEFIGPVDEGVGYADAGDDSEGKQRRKRTRRRRRRVADDGEEEMECSLGVM